MNTNTRWHPHTAGLGSNDIPFVPVSNYEWYRLWNEEKKKRKRWRTKDIHFFDDDDDDDDEHRSNFYTKCTTVLNFIYSECSSKLALVSKSDLTLVDNMTSLLRLERPCIELTVEEKICYHIVYYMINLTWSTGHWTSSTQTRKRKLLNNYYLCFEQ